MNTGARRSRIVEAVGAEGAGANGSPEVSSGAGEQNAAAEIGAAAATKLKVFVAAENRLLREALARMLMKKGGIEVTGAELTGPVRAEEVAGTKADVLLLTSRGTLKEDLLVIHEVRASGSEVRILMLGMAKNDAEFLQYVRAGISGYLLHDTSAEELVKGVRAVYEGEAVCPGKLCTALFRYFESEAAALPCASSRRRLGLTRREQQLIPYIAKGLTNKEIANHFSLSEQTVKNHLYRMKHKTGAGDRLDIVQLYRVQGFLV